MTKSNQYFVDVRHRPRRVAFLLDMDRCPDAQFDGIVDFSVSTWGGRYNPIIPVVNGQISDSYWQLLKLANPDILYTYCDLSAETVANIVSRVRPLDVLRHNFSRQPVDNDFPVQIDRQASVLRTLSRVMREFPVWTRAHEPVALSFESKDASGLSSFVRRNFGANSHYYFYCRDNGIPSLTVSPHDKDVMKALTTNQNLVLPINVCAEGPRNVHAFTPDVGIALTLCYGSTPWDFVEYWNLAHFRGTVRATAPSLPSMWVKPSFLEDSEFYQAFLELMRRRVFASQQRRGLRLISYDQSIESVRELTKRICIDLKWSNLYPAEPVIKLRNELSNFEPSPVIEFFPHQSARPVSKQLSGSRSFLELSPPGDAPAGMDERWVAEFAVEDPGQERYLENRTAWWKLPQKDGVANLILPQAPCRVGNDFLISAEVSGQQQGVMLSTPDLRSLFARLILPQASPKWLPRLDNLSPRTSRLNTFYVRSSDKGMYARGVLGLFESLKKAAYIFEHEFWRGVLESLSSAVASQHTRNKVTKDMRKIDADILKSDSGIDVLVDEVLDAAGRIQRPIPYLNFGSLFGRYWKYIAALSKEGQFSEVTQIHSNLAADSNEKVIRESARTNLRQMLSELTAKRVFLHGAEVRCDYCLASLWYHVDDLRSVVTCRGCRKELNLPAEIPWSYALNELVVSAIRDHGVIPVIRTAFRLFEDSRECFCFLPGIEVRDYENSPDAHVCELDLVWVRDGEFGIAEVKRTTKNFSIGEKLVNLLDTSRPDQFLLACPSGSNQQMEQVRSDIQLRVGANVPVEAWGPDTFARHRYIGWNTVAYSVL